LEVIIPAVTENVFVVAPAATVTEAGTVRSPLLLDRETVAPPAGAGEAKVMVQVDTPLLAKLVSVHPSDVNADAGVSVKFACWEPALYVAVTTAVWLLGTVPAVAVNVLLVVPAATKIEAGTVNDPLLLESPIADPPEGAPPDRFTEQVDVPPPLRLVGTHVIELRVTWDIREIAEVCEAPPKDAVTLAVWLVVIVPAVAVKVAVDVPAATVTEAGTVIDVMLVDSATATPPLGAAWFNVTVQTEDAPALSETGLQAMPLTVTWEGTEMLPPLEFMAIAAPPVDAATGLFTLIRIVPDAVAESVALTIASVPFWIVVVLSPLTRQVTVPLPVAQLSVLEAAVAALPADTLRLAILDAL
jgi:hypothetical protein